MARYLSFRSARVVSQSGLGVVSASGFEPGLWYSTTALKMALTMPAPPAMNPAVPMLADKPDILTATAQCAAATVVKLGAIERCGGVRVVLVGCVRWLC